MDAPLRPMNEAIKYFHSLFDVFVVLLDITVFGFLFYTEYRFVHHTGGIPDK